MDSNTGLALIGFALVFCTAIGFWTSMAPTIAVTVDSPPL